MSKFARPQHELVVQILSMLDAGFLEKASCYFGGGTRIVMSLAEFRESADIDLLCASRAGYRALRSTVTQESLGRIARKRVVLAREVIADRYGIRTFIEVSGQKIKFEIVYEGRIDISAAADRAFPVPVLDQVSCFSEKFLANADRWNDESTLSRDIVDLAFMMIGWGRHAAESGLKVATQAYGKVVSESGRKAVNKLRDQKAYFRRCVTGLGIEDSRTLSRGLTQLMTV